MSSYHQPDGFDDALALANGGAATSPRPETAHHGPSDGPHQPSNPGRDRQPPPAARDWATARTVARGAVRAGDPVELPLHRAARHTLAEPLAALTDLPAFDTSAMDGWAVAGPGPWTLAESAEVLAGGGAPARLADGEAVPIATGARVPTGATAVLRGEYGTVDAAPGGPGTGRGRLTASQAPRNGTDIRPRGQECRTGDLLLPAGARVTPAVLGLAAAAGYDRLSVTRRPRVEVLVLGAELLHDGVPHGGLIRDALGPLLEPWLTELGADVTAVRHLGDDADALADAVAAAPADLVLTTGGTAAGPVDHVRPLLARLGARLLVDSVAVRPGHPMLLAELPEHADHATGLPDPDRPASRHLVGLPGNPLAAISGLLTLVEPVLRGLTDRDPDAEPPTARLTEGVTGHPVDTRLVPVAQEPRGVRPLRFHGPAMLRGVASASALAVIPPGGVRGGSTVALLTLPHG